jgi:hypothetical protein
MVFSLVPINYSFEDYKIDRRPPKRRPPRIRR